VSAGRFQAIIFDVGRVLVRVDFKAALAGIAAGSPLKPEEVWRAIQQHPLWQGWQEGRVSPQEWHKSLCRSLGADLSFEQFCTAWNRAVSPEPVLRDSLLEGLSRSYLLAVLSNTDPLHIAHEEANFPVFRHFPVRIYSCVVGACKPDPAMYRAALAACGTGGGEALFIDDIPEYVAAAQKLGISGIVFESPSQLETALKEFQVIP
jgi:putative hydrolase of the HAD superfamily